ncbi:MAG: hemolysin family protein [Oscillospiraceae bacterium]|nr:hemolysin family protein [Oscillospiraceae bacterium]
MSDPDGTISLMAACVISIVGLLLYGVFSGAQAALERTNERKLTELLERRPDRLEKALSHLERPQRFLATTALVRMITAMVPAVCMAMALTPVLSGAFAGDGPVQPWQSWLALAIVLAGMICLWLFLGNLIPRKLAANTPEKSLVHTMAIVNGAAILLRPVTVVFTGISNAIVSLMGKDPHLEDKPVTEEEIMRMIDESEEDGEIAGVEADMIGNIFDFNDKSVSEIMTHRMDVVAVEDTASIQDVVKTAVEHGYSRIPVYHDDIDTIIGVVYVKDLLNFIGKPLSRNISVKALMRKPYLVPESKALNELFTEMTERKTQFAVLIDEYGGTEGIVTMEDILESIVGNIQDEYDNEEASVVRLSDTLFAVDGAMPVDEVSELLEMELPEGDYDTIAGMVVEMLGNIPDENEFPSVMVDNVEFQVLEFRDNRIEKVLIEQHPQQKDEDEES